jgi:hypothetical protein
MPLPRGPWDNLRERIKLTCIHLPCLQAKYGTGIKRRQLLHVNTPERVYWRNNQSRHAEPQNTQRLFHRDVNQFRDHHFDFRRAGQPVVVDIPAFTCQQLTARCRQSG